MPPITIKLKGYVYNYLYTVQQQAVLHARTDYPDKEDYFKVPTLLMLAITELKVKDPTGILFPKKGKVVRMTVIQAVALHVSLSQFLDDPLDYNQNFNAIELLYLLDQALTNYSPVYGYKG
ncbi:hypothetical protein [Spirosoma sp. 48-14]|uniref:hypothetical protein n=1 Tax=Spirosoma sp. 48-14 TaxID=1895854 RepID=UPI000964EFE8|nr:hypothetical protein [Spirosoma sp. 48-14]OJW76318.1 MAG: hypothetical protein BGO59_22630 [Spirosoma sp. 48-14]